MDESKVQVVGDRVLIRRERTTTRSGLLVPETAQFQCFGRVVGVGESFGLDREGKPKPALEGLLGKRVLFDPQVTYEFPGDVSLLLMHSAGLWAVIEEEAELPLVLPAAKVH